MAHVDVIMPVYNGESFLREAIESVLAQTYTDWRFVISDNASTDATAAIAAEYAAADPRIEHVRFEELLPIIENWNRAVDQLSDDAAYMKVLHADDFFEPDCFADMVALGHQHPNVGLIGALGIRRNMDLGPDERDSLEFEDFPSDGCVNGHEANRGFMRHIARAEGGYYMFGSPTQTMVRADLVRSVAHFYEPDEMHADTEACCRILMTSDFGFVRKPLTATREWSGRNEAKTSILKTGHISEMKILDRYGPELFDADEFDRLRRTAWDDYYNSLAEGVVQLRRGDFWRYHKPRVEALGERLDVLRIARKVPRIFFAKVRSRLARLARR